MTNPRIMVVESLATPVDPVSQNVNLVLLDRDHSAEFAARFPQGSRPDALDYARRYGIADIGKHGVSHEHRRIHQFPGHKYHLGDIVTEKEAFDFGYVEPHLDTTCIRIAELWENNDHSKVPLTERLREQGLIAKSQVARRQYAHGHMTLNIVDSEVADRQSFLRGGPDKSRPVMLLIFNRTESGELPIGCAYFVPDKNTIYEFMAYAPAIKPVSRRGI